ncbi:MAG: septum formation initiator family protein [Gemmatimonadota bacterium]|nr:septum formation initiator family protein [Gemmatimonadota bacterium]MDE2863709.1 septum formation initiator family protein [Gemmatimonadota bacterium]
MKRSRRLFLPGVIIVAVYFAMAGGDHSVLDARRAEDELAATRAETRRVHRQVDSLRARIAGLREDDEMLERYARERYGFIRDGEYLYRISEPEPVAQEEVRDTPSILRWLRSRDDM